MNTQETKEYLDKILPGFSIRIEENYKGKPNNRLVFERNGVDAAVLLARKLPVNTQMLDDLAAAVKNRYDNAPEKKVESFKKNVDEIPEAEVSSDKLADSAITAGKNKVSYDLYLAAKKVVETYEQENPMT